MVTITQDQLEKARKLGYSTAQIEQEIARSGATVLGNSDFRPTITTPQVQSSLNNADFQSKTLAERQSILSGGATPVSAVKTSSSPVVTTNTTPAKPTIATSDNPVIGNEPATTTTTFDLTSANSLTPDQLKAKYYELSTKKEFTEDDRTWAKYLQTKANIEAGGDIGKLFSNSKSSGTTTYSQQLNRLPEQIASSQKNADGTYTVTYKDGATQVITEPPSRTEFPEGTPEYFAQKQADEAEKRIKDLEAQMNTEAERRKKETEDLVKQYGENIASQFQAQKAEIEAQGAKRMEALNNGLSFSGFGRSTLALEKRDEIAKNIETTINQAKAKADLELMAYRMEREGADQEAIATMRNNIANVQQKIDDANYANQLAIIKLNQENATTGSEAMMNLLNTISNGQQVGADADITKSQELGYFVDKDGKVMIDSQGRPIKFESSTSNLEPDQIQAYADALKNKIIDEKALDKLSPNDKAAVLKHSQVLNGTWTGGFTDISQATGDVTQAPGAQQYANIEAWATTNNPSGITVNPAFSKKLDAAGISYTTKPRPADEGGEYYVFADIADGLKAHQIALKQSGWNDVYTRLYNWSAGGTKDTPEATKKANKTAYANELMAAAGIEKGTKFTDLTPDQENKLLSAQIKRESPHLYAVLGQETTNTNITGPSGAPLDFERRIKQMVPTQLMNSDTELKQLNTAIKSLSDAGYSPEDAVLTYLGFSVKDPAKKEETIQLVRKARGLGEDLPASFLGTLSDYVNREDIKGAKNYTDRIIEGALSKKYGTEFVSTPNLTFQTSILTRLNNFIDKNATKIGPLAGRWADLSKNFKNDKDYQALSTLLSGSIAEIRRAFGGTAVTDSELRALRDFIGMDTKMPIDNLRTALQTNFDTLQGKYDSQRSFYVDEYTPTVTPPTVGGTGGGQVSSGAFDLDA